VNKGKRKDRSLRKTPVRALTQEATLAVLLRRLVVLVALSPGWRAWRAEDIHPGFRRDGDEPLHVRRTVERWRQKVFGGGLIDISHESFEQKRSEADQGFPSIGRLRATVRFIEDSSLVITVPLSESLRRFLGRA
jgi:hypothetical protein